MFEIRFSQKVIVEIFEKQVFNNSKIYGNIIMRMTVHVEKYVSDICGTHAFHIKTMFNLIFHQQERVKVELRKTLSK